MLSHVELVMVMLLLIDIIVSFWYDLNIYCFSFLLIASRRTVF